MGAGASTRIIKWIGNSNRYNASRVPIMIKITQAQYLQKRILRLSFSDNSYRDYDLQPLIDRQTELVSPLNDERYFKQFFLELGALCWRNGLELSPGNIHRKLAEQGLLCYETKMALSIA
jgi:hypothetical protein